MQVFENSEWRVAATRYPDHLPCSRSYLEDIVRKYGTPSRTELEDYQISALEKGSFEFPSPFSMHHSEVESSYLCSDKTVFYKFSDDKKEFLICFSDISIGFPITAIYLYPCDSLIRVHDTVWRPSIDTARRAAEALALNKALNVRKSLKAIVVTGDANFAHHLWNQLGILYNAAQGPLGGERIRAIVTDQPLGSINRIIPRLTNWSWDYILSSNLEQQNASDRLFIVPAGFLVIAEVRILLKEVSRYRRSHASDELERALEGKSSIWVSIRSDTRTPINQVDALYAVCKKFALNTDCHIILDGFTPALDIYSSISGSWQESERKIARDHVVALEIYNRLIKLGQKIDERIHIIVGWTILDAVSIQSSVNFYFCHAGTTQHKIGWLTPCNGVIHSNLATIHNDPGIWSKSQTDSDFSPSVIDSSFVEDIEAVEAQDVQVASLNNQNYFLRALPDLASAVLERYRECVGYPADAAISGTFQPTPASFKNVQSSQLTRRLVCLSLGRLSCFFVISPRGLVSGPWTTPHEAVDSSVRRQSGDIEFGRFAQHNLKSESVVLEDHLACPPTRVTDFRLDQKPYSVWLVELSNVFSFYLVETYTGVISRSFESLDKAIHSAEVDREITSRTFEISNTAGWLIYLNPVGNIRHALCAIEEKIARWSASKKHLPCESVIDVACSLIVPQRDRIYSRGGSVISGATDWIASAHEAQAQVRDVTAPKAMLAELRDVVLLDQTFLISKDGYVVTETLVNATEPGIFGSIERRDGEGVYLQPSVEAPAWFANSGLPVLIKQRWDNNYDHWLVESLPRIEIVAQKFKIENCCFLVGSASQAMRDVYRDTLRFLGISSEQIFELSGQPIVFDRLLYPSPVTIHPWVKAPWIVAFLDRLGRRVPIGKAGPPKLYLRSSRVKAGFFDNDREIAEILRDRGFVVFDEVSDLKFSEQVDLFRCASHVVGVLDPYLVNLAFAPKGVRYLALCSDCTQDDFLWDLVSLKRGSYYSLHGKQKSKEAGLQRSLIFDRHSFGLMVESFDS